MVPRFDLRASFAFLIAGICALALQTQTAKAQFFLFDWLQAPQTTKQNTTMRVHRVAFPPQHQPGQIIVSFADRKLYWIHARGQALAYPIATPRRGDGWRGSLPITRKVINPSWTPTAQMRRENPRLPSFVPGGHPQNPMGSHALYLGSTLYRIHGTDAPWTIGRPVSRGCIRMHNAHVAHLFAQVPVGTNVTVSYKSFANRAVW